MPCRDDWPSPSGAQVRSQRAAGLLIFLYEKLGKPVTESLKRDANDCYCNTDYVRVLCALLKSMGEEERDAFIYVARDKRARALADWWEEHLEADRARVAEEEAENRRRELEQSARSKLTPEELRALGIKE